MDDVRLGEDEYFECQVSPGKGAINSVPLRAPVKINIQGKEGVQDFSHFGFENKKALDKQNEESKKRWMTKK